MSLFCALLAAVTTAPATDDPLPSLRQLCVEAPIVVLAEPVVPAAPTHFKVVRSLRGEVRPGTVVRAVNLSLSEVTGFDPPDTVGGRPRPWRFTQALLFLKGPKETLEGGFDLLPGGLRLCTHDGRVMSADALGRRVTVRGGSRWAGVVRQAQEDVATADAVRGYRRLGRPERRSQALLAWAESQRAALRTAAAGSDEAPAGWEGLQSAVFEWACESAPPAVAWRAVRLYADIYEGELFVPRAPG